MSSSGDSNGPLMKWRFMAEKLWSECSKEEHDEVREWSRRVRRFHTELIKGYYTAHGAKERIKEFGKELTQIERKYGEDDTGN